TILLICAYSIEYPVFFFFNATATTEIYTLSLHDALPISSTNQRPPLAVIIACRRLTVLRSIVSELSGARPIEKDSASASSRPSRSEEHTSELQSPYDLVCRLLLEKKK